MSVAKATDAERIARLHVPDEEDVPAEVKELWALPLEKLGFVPNVLRVFALRPRHLLGWWAYYEELLRGESGLTKAQRGMQIRDRAKMSARDPPKSRRRSIPTGTRC